MTKFRFKVAIKNLEYVGKLFEFEVSKHGDWYIIPAISPASQFAHTGSKLSFHPSGRSHLGFDYPIACLSSGPKIRLPFDRNELVRDIMTKKQSLLSEEIDPNTLNKAGMVAILKTNSAIRNFLSLYSNKWLGNPDYIDYYNLVLTNRYFPTSYFRDKFPFNNIEIDSQQVEKEIMTYECDNMGELFVNLKNSGNVQDTDMLNFAPYDGSCITSISGSGKGFTIDLNNIENTIRKLPGANPLYDVVKIAHNMLVDRQ